MFNKSRDHRHNVPVHVKGLTLEKFLKWVQRFPDSTAVKLNLPWDKIYFQHVSKISTSSEELVMESSSQLVQYLRLSDFRQLQGACSQRVLKHPRMTMSMVDIDARSGSIILS